MSDNSSEEFNQRSMRAIILCVMVAIIYTQFFLAPQKKAVQQQQQQQAAQIPQQQPQAVASQQQPLPTAATGATSHSASSQAIQQHPSVAEIAAATSSLIDTGVARVSVTHLGGRLSAYKVTGYKRDLSGDESLDLVGSGEGAPLPLGLYVGAESDERVRYSLAAINGTPVLEKLGEIQLDPGARTELEFKGTLQSGVQVTKKLSFTGGSYLVGVTVMLDRPISNSAPVWLEWNHFFSSEAEKALRIKHSISFLDVSGKVRHVPIEKVGYGIQDYGANTWATLGDTYFANVLIPTGSAPSTVVGREGDTFFIRVAGAPTGGTFYSYVGPKDYKTLEATGDFQLERTVDLGWFSFLALPLLWMLRFLYQIFGNYGVAIIGLTLMVKAVMLPLSKASFESARKMQDLQPEMKALRERVKDPNQLNQEMFALYKRKGVNPMGGCFPMLIQIPVFLGLYNALLNALELRHSPYALWIRDLSAPESLHLFGIGVPVMVLLMAASMVYQTWTTPNPSADPNQQKMMMIMPLVFAGMFIVFPMPAGLVLYWLTNNIISIIQQLYMRNAHKGSVYVGTAMASAIIFGVGYLLTLV